MKTLIGKRPDLSYTITRGESTLPRTRRALAANPQFLGKRAQILMGVVNLLETIRPVWIERLSHGLARGAGVRENFQDELNRLYDLLIQAAETGDPSWLDPLVEEWTRAQTRTDLDADRAGLTPFLTQAMLLTFEVCQDALRPDKAVAVIGAVLPLFTHAYERSARIELEIQMARVRRQLDRARLRLEQLDRSKSTFISVAAHELKTPLTLIEGYAAMLRELLDDPNPEARPLLMLKGIDNGTERLREIVDDMIDVSLIDNELLSLNFQPVWVSHLLQVLDGEFRGATEQRGQVFDVVKFPGSQEMIYGDPERLHQALRNVVLNAIKYTPDGGRIRVHGRRLPGFLEIIVSDTGIGIDPEHHNRIFEKFGQIGDAQLHSSGKTKFKGGGPGLGLPIAKGIVEAHGGTIWVESEGCDEETNPGSTFHILLPIRKEPPGEGASLLYDSLPKVADPSLATPAD